MFPIRVKTVQESDLRMLGSLARNIQRVLPVTQADIDAAAALGKGWVVWKVFEVSDPLDNMRGGTQLIIRQNSIQPGQNVRRVIFVVGPGGQTVVIRGTDYIVLPDAIANSLSYVKAFGGTEQRNLPDGYIERQFIYMMDGSYLLTDIVPTYDCKIEIDFGTTTVSASKTVLGGRTATYGGIELIIAISKNFVVDAFGTSSSDRYSSSVTAQKNKRYKFTYDNQVATLESGGSTLFTNTMTGTAANGAALCINGNNDSGSVGGVGEIYLYSFKVWNAQGELVADYVPAVQKGTVPVVGFYDTVSETFKTATSGTFAAGGEAVPTPDAPMDIVSNNGVLRIQGSATGTVTQTGNPTPTTPVEPVFYQNHGLLLRAIDTDADTYDASTQTITRNIGYYIFDGTESFGSSSAYGKALYVNAAANAWDAKKSKDVLCQYFLGASSPSGSMPEFTCFFNASGHFYFRTAESATNFKAWLAELYANGTPLIVWFVDNTPETESFTPSVYADGTVETINAHGKNLINVADRTVPSNSSTNALWSGSFTGVFRLSVDTSKVTSVENPSTRFLRITVNGNTTYINYNSCDSISINGTLTDIYCYGSYGFARVRGKISLQLERGTATTPYEPYYDGGTATAEMLLKVGDYQDEQEILSGAVTRNVGVKVFDGTENWKSSVTSKFFLDTSYMRSYNKMPVSCTHYDAVLANSTSNVGYGKIGLFASGTQGASSARLVIGDDNYTSVSSFKAFLANQYDAGTPVIVVYPRATPTTESVTGQTLQVTDGDNTLEITQASLTGLELEAQYNAAVSLTIQEVEDANLDNNVTVTIQ